MESNKYILRKFDNRNNRSDEHRQENQIPEPHLQIYEINRKTNYLDINQALDLLTNWNGETMKLLNQYKKNSDNQTNIQNIRNLHNEIFYSISSKQSMMYKGVNPYIIITEDSAKLTIPKLLEILSNDDNNVDSNTQNREFIEEFNNNLKALKEISDIYLEKELSFTDDPTQQIENDVDEKTLNNLVQAKENKDKHSEHTLNNKKLDIAHNKIDKANYIKYINNELSQMAQQSGNREGRVIFDDKVDQEQIMHVPIKLPSKELNLNKKPVKPIIKLNRDYQF